MIKNQRSGLNFILCYNNLFINILHNINPNICIPYLKLNLIEYKHYNGFILFTPKMYISKRKEFIQDKNQKINKFYGMLFTYDFFTFYDDHVSKLKKNYISVDNLFISKYHRCKDGTIEDGTLFLAVPSFELSHSAISSVFWIPIS